MFSQPPPLYTHYQPPPQPMHPVPQSQQPQQPLSQYQQPVGQSPASSMTAPPPPPSFIGQPQAGGAFNSTNGVFQPHNGTSAIGMGVGSGAGDFELFGPSSPRQTQQPRSQPLLAYRQPFQQLPRQQPTHRGHRAPYPISIPSSSSSESSQDDTDYPPLPDLVADDGSAPSPTASFSPPSPRFISPIRPGLLKELGGAVGGQAGFSGLNGYGMGYKGERASSVPAPEPPRPMRRKTQESRDWPSFYSSGSSSSSSSQASAGQAASANGGGLLDAPFAAQAYTDEPAAFVTPTGPTANPFDAANLVLSPAQQLPSVQNPHPTPPYTDHPLLPSEQSDLLDRVRRDLLDVDLSSIKGPLRALALSRDRDSTPTPGLLSHSSPIQQQPTLPQHLPQQVTPKSALLRSPAQEDALSAGTVSPQEAFLDYNEVDSRLHDPSDPLFSGGSGRSTEFGVGVGGSLFAPLPQATAAATAGTVSPTPSYRAQSPHLVPHTPSTATSLPLARDRSSTPPTISSPRHGARRGPHPFSVPQNAVTWAERRSLSGHRLVGGVVDGDADDDDGDFGTDGEPSQEHMERDEEEAEKRRLEAVRREKGLKDGFGRFEEGDVDVSKPEGVEMSEAETWRYGVKSELKDEENEAGYPLVAGKGVSRVPVLSTFAPALPPLPQHPSSSYNSFAAPRPSSASSTAASVASGFSAFQHELAKQRQGSHGFAPPAAASLVSGDGGTSTPRRTAAASALASLNALAGWYAAQQGQPRGPVGAEVQQSPVRPQRKRKPSQMAKAAYGLVSDEDAEDAPGEPDDSASAPPPLPASATPTVSSDADGDVGGESDASYHSSQSSYQAAPARRRGTPSGSSAPPNKRRRRNPATSTSRSSGGGGGGGGGGSGSIRCDHLNSDGSTCGVIFRRPYDLARHKETIHGEGLKGEKVRVKEWKCEQCGGTFSRKDALLRHGRIRGHKTGR
ncbi:hypothetical protein JCM10295v2_001427 [Rhodotorula toruloides]